VSAEGGDNIIGVRTVYDAVLRLEGKVDAQSSRFDAEIDIVKTEQTYLRGKIDGSLGMVKWLGPSGVAAVFIGIAKATGLL
jgi:hypothetical protein